MEEEKKCMKGLFNEVDQRNRMEDSIWSRNEKDALESICKPEDPLVNPETKEPYTTITTQAANGEDQTLYMVPYDQMKGLVRRLWPFHEEPRFDEPYIDLHSGQEVWLKDVNIVRVRDRNIIAAPDYLSTGGMVIDLFLKSSIPEADEEGPASLYKKLKQETGDEQ